MNFILADKKHQEQQMKPFVYENKIIKISD